jgi:hypothetical protein
MNLRSIKRTALARFRCCGLPFSFQRCPTSRQKTAHRFAESGHESGYIFELCFAFSSNPSILGFFAFQYDSCDRRQTAKIGSLFDPESILPLYNYGNPIQTRAAFSNDNKVIKMLFHGTLAFAQNFEPFKSRAAKERVISIKFSTDELTDDSKAAYDQVCALPVPKLAGFLLAVLKEREFFESNWRQYHEQAKKDL